MSTSLSNLTDNLSEINKKNVNHAKKEEKLYLSATLLVLKIIDYITNVKNVMMNHLNQ